MNGNQHSERAGVPLAAAWCETFGEFADWLDDAGVTVEGLPTWAPTRPVRVLALAPGRLFIEKVSRRHYRSFKRMVAVGGKRLVARPVASLSDMHELEITDVDAGRMAEWQGQYRPETGMKPCPN